ncbi:MAG: phosphodiester glycosidase family protein [Sphingomonas sp.]|uniref:phosphodiester glycosidase family protein n=1 Tax=Sphingomonas sp. TaxID=28214 RepID=UPI0025D8D17C|nr:phosphodiester glycosidase family protein [Sphingomonas sp.]MBX3564875.1 phosphodiester glycosidase family protein [Sphingomonas sp.]
MTAKSEVVTPFLRLFALAGLLALAACGRGGNVAEACQDILFEGARFTACHASPQTHDLVLVNRGADGQPMRDFAGLEKRLGERYANLAFAMNAGMFDAKGAAIGYYVEDGAEQTPLNRKPGPGNFHLLPNGVFWGDTAGWHADTTDNFAAMKPDHVRFATQSGPMLLIRGRLHPQISDNGASLQIRNGVGVSVDGTAWFAISNESVSFGRFARLFRDKLACPDALYFDGAVSRLFDPVAGRKDGGAPIGPIVVAVQKR